MLPVQTVYYISDIIYMYAHMYTHIALLQLHACDLHNANVYRGEIRSQ